MDLAGLPYGLMRNIVTNRSGIQWDELLGQPKIVSIQSNVILMRKMIVMAISGRYMNRVRQYKNTLLGQILGSEPLLLVIIDYDREHRPIAWTFSV